MANWNQYPYTDFHQLNLDWIISLIKALDEKVDTYLEYNSIKYADPLLWDITSQYEVNTVVITSDGTAYISVQPVPTGISISRTEYWTPIGNFTELFEPIKEAISEHDNGYTPTSLFTLAEGDLFWFENVLYQALTAINAGDAFVEGTNCAQITVEDYIETLDAGVDTKISNAINALETSIQTQIDALDDSVTNIQQTVDGLSTRFSNIVNLHALEDSSIFYYHVNGINGSDDNDGLSTSTPFRTVVPIFNKLNNTEAGKNDIRIQFDVDAEYEMPHHSIDSCVLHIKGQGPATILNFTTSLDPTIYNSHVNIQNVTIKTNDPSYGFKIDGCTFLLTSVTFNQKLRVHASMGQIGSCNLQAVEATYSNLYFNTVTNNNTDPAVNGYSFTDCNVGFQGSCTCVELDDVGSSNSYIYARSSTLLGAVTIPSFTTGKYHYGLNLVNAYVQMPQNNLNQLRTRTTAGINHASNAAGMIQENRGSVPVVISTQMVRYNESTNKLEYWDQSSLAWTEITL